MEMSWVEFRAKVYDMLGWWYYPSMPATSWVQQFETYKLITSPTGRYKTRRFVHGRAFGGHDFEFAEVEAIDQPRENNPYMETEAIRAPRGFRGAIFNRFQRPGHGFGR